MKNRSSSNLLQYYKQFSNFERTLNDHLISPPMINIIFKNKQGLNYNADLISFSKNVWNQNPMQFCLDYYNNAQYYPIILICNTLNSMYEFTLNNLKNGIISPLKDDIIRILNFPSPTDMRY